MQQDLTETSVTDAVLEQMAATPDPRLREIMASLVRHLHSFARDVRLTPSEWLAAIAFLTRTGQICTPARQEFILLSDTLGLSALVNIMDGMGADEAATEGSLLGPFYQQRSPQYALGDQIAVAAKGPELQVYGTVRDRQGTALPGATIQVWQTDAEGSYDLQRDGGARMDMRGTFTADDQGRYHFRTLRPLGYYIPLDGPVGEMIRAQGRHGCRPAHIHFLVNAPGRRELVTALYLSDDPHIGSDTVFGVSSSLVVSPEQDPEAPVPGIPAIRYDFVLGAARGNEAGRVGADPSQILAQAG
jgi:hydroxyquinol 1,2-dioxygenase